MTLSAGVVLGGLMVVWTVLYTVNFGRWVWAQGAKKGALGVWFLAALVTLAPLFVLFRGSK